MSLLNDPGFKSKYQKCKNKVKKWETQFKKLHNRNPDKVYIFSFLYLYFFIVRYD